MALENMKYIIPFIALLLLLVSCSLQINEQGAITQEQSPYQKLITLLSTEIPTYEAVYEKTSSTAGSGTEQTMHVKVIDGKLVYYQSQSIRNGPGYGHNCTKLYSGGDNWDYCECTPIFYNGYLSSEDAKIEYELRAGSNVEDSTSCLDSKLPENIDQQLKETGVEYMNQTNQTDESMVSFVLESGRTCYAYNRQRIWCFTENGLLVTTTTGAPHPVITNVVGYPLDETVYDALSIALGEVPDEDVVEEYEPTQEEKEEELQMEIDRLSGNLNELPYYVEQLFELLDEKKSEMSDEDYQKIYNEIQQLQQEVEEKNELYEEKINDIQEVFDEQGYDSGYDLFIAIEDDGYTFYDYGEQRLAEIRVLIGKAIGLS